MKFRLPYQIYRTGVISRSNSPGNNVYRFSKGNEDKVRKKTSKTNNPFHAIISNFIYNFTHLPLKVSISKLRNRTRLKSSTKTQKAKIRNEIVFLKNDFIHKKSENVKKTNKTSDFSINSIKCANFLCAKSTAKILLQQKDLLCNIQTEKNINRKDENPKESKDPKRAVTKSTNIEKEMKGMINATSPPLKKNKKSLEIPIEEKHKTNEHKRKLNKSEENANSTELKRLKRLLHSCEEIRNYKIDENPPGPIRIDKVMETRNYPKKLPELPVQFVPKTEEVCPKWGPILVTPKRIYTAPEVTRNYKPIENVHHCPPRMDNLVRSNTESNNRSSDTKRSHENNALNSQQSVIPFEIDEAVNELKPKTKRSNWTAQQQNKANNKIFEELVNSPEPHIKIKSSEVNSRLHEVKQVAQSKKLEENYHNILAPKLSPFAIANIRRKYYPSDNFPNEKLKTSTLDKVAPPIIEKTNMRTDTTKLEHLYSRSKVQYKNVNYNLLGINPNDNIKKKHAKSNNAKQKNLITIDDYSKSDFFGDGSSCFETSMNNIISHKVLIPPPSKSSTAPGTKRNYSSTTIDEYKESLNGYTDLLNSSFNLIKSSIATTSNLSDKVSSTQGMFSTSIKKFAEIHSEVPRAKKINKMEFNNNQPGFDNLKQDRNFSLNICTKNVDHNGNTRNLDKPKRNLSKEATKAASTLNNQDNALSPEDGKLNYRNYDELRSIPTNLNDHEMAPINLRDTEYSSATLVTNAAEIINERYQKMLIDKRALINNYIQWKMQLNKFGNLTKKCTKPSKCCLQFMNKIYKQNKYKMRKCKIISGKQKNMSDDNFVVGQDQNELVDTTLNDIKSRVAQKCAMFDKISDALLTKSDIINNSNHTNIDVQQTKLNIKNLRHSNKRQLSEAPELDSWLNNIMLAPELRTNKPVSVQEAKSVNPAQEAKNLIPLQEGKNIQIQMAKNVIPVPEGANFIPFSEPKIVIPVSEAKNLIPIPKVKNIQIQMGKNVIPVQEGKNVIPYSEPKNVIPVSEAKNFIPVLSTKNDIEYMDVDIPSLELTRNTASARTRAEIGYKRPICQISSTKNICLQRSMKVIPPIFPATLKAKKFLAKIEAEQFGNMLVKKIKHQKSIKTKVLRNDKIGKYTAYAH